MASTQPPHPVQLAQQVRERLAGDAVQGLGAVSTAVQEAFTALMNQTATAREMQARRDLWTMFQKRHSAWVAGTSQAWVDAARQSASSAVKVRPATLSLELLGDEVVENKIIASRMALPVIERVSAGFDDLRLRVQQLEGGRELPSSDMLRPEVLVQMLVDQWVFAGLDRVGLLQVADTLQNALSEQLLGAYGKANTFLVAQGVVPHIDLRARVKRAAESPTGAAPPSASAHDGRSTRSGPVSFGGSGSQGYPSRHGSPSAHGASSPAQPYDQGSYANTPGNGGGFAATPLGRARARAQGIMGQLKRLLVSQVSEFAHTEAQPVSPALLQAVAPRVEVAPTGSGAGQFGATLMEDYSPAGLVLVSQEVRNRSTELKQKASTDGEKATIEVVGLMFQSILTEERIPPNVRVWFSRLQVPVLRVALAEPEFLSTLNHPARMLIDRMGSCVLGFDSSAISGSAMEAEIRRVVQVIEQYPETGRRVFQLVLAEFEKFLATFLTAKKSTSRAVSVAQQIEQKETLAIQYTIELRTLLTDMPMREEIRTFLFKVWAEVLAVADLRDGPQDPLTLALKKTASDLVWSASAKPNRADRTKVIQNLPVLLQRLRQGLTLLGVAGPVQDVHIKVISDTLADAFLSKTEAIPQAQVDAMAQRLASLEEFVLDESMGDLPLDPGSIEMMLGMDASSITVVTDGDAQPSADMLAWAHEMQTGDWFTLDHNGTIKQVQFAWRSNRKQLFLFAALDGSSFLIQARRLAVYLQAGLMKPHEEEALTQRATREALVKLDANPERLLS